MKDFRTLSPYLDSSIGGSGQLGLSDVVMTK